MIKDAKFEVDDHIRISKYKNIFAKVYDPNWSEEVFVIKKVTNTVPWTYVMIEMVINQMREKVISYMLSGKAMINHLMVQLIERYRYIKWVILQNHIFALDFACLNTQENLTFVKK